MSANTSIARILIVRLSAIGDIVVSTGLISSLQARYPDAQISWVCEPMGAPLLIHNPNLKEVIIWPKNEWKAQRRAGEWRALWKSISSFRQLLQSRRFDLVVDPQGLLKSGVVAWMTGAPRRVSAFAREGSHLLCHERVLPPHHDAPAIGQEARDLAIYLGANPQSFKLDLAVGDRQLNAARRLLPASDRPLVALCPFTTRPQKHWVESRWPNIARELSQKGLQPVLLGGPNDTAAAHRITAQAPTLLNLVGRLQLDETAAAISLCHGLIGVDTGLTHMGTAFGIPTLALFGSTCPYTKGQDDLTHVMYDAMACSPCHRKPTCGGSFDCMGNITEKRVLDQFFALLDRSRHAVT